MEISGNQQEINTKILKMNAFPPGENKSGKNKITQKAFSRKKHPKIPPENLFPGIMPTFAQKSAKENKLINPNSNGKLEFGFFI